MPHGRADEASGEQRCPLQNCPAWLFTDTAHRAVSRQEDQCHSHAASSQMPSSPTALLHWTLEITHARPLRVVLKLGQTVPGSSHRAFQVFSGHSPRSPDLPATKPKIGVTGLLVKLLRDQMWHKGGATVPPPCPPVGLHSNILVWIPWAGSRKGSDMGGRLSHSTRWHH